MKKSETHHTRGVGGAFNKLHLAQQLTASSLRASIKESGLAGSMQLSAPLLVDCMKMESYTKEARGDFIEWIRARSSKLSRIAIVTDKPLWHVVISGIALATRTSMRAFSSVGPAEKWLIGGETAVAMPSRKPARRGAGGGG